MSSSPYCYYTKQVYECCHAPYTTSYPPQLRHSALCQYPLSKTQTPSIAENAYSPCGPPPKLICATLNTVPVTVAIPGDCKSCAAVKEDGVLRRNFKMEVLVGDEGKGEEEWVLCVRNENDGVGDEAGDIKEKWIRVKTDNREWREAVARKEQVEGCEIVLFEGMVEWVVLR